MISFSAASRPAGLVSAAPWCRRLTAPRAWKVCTTGICRASAARRAAIPDIQKCACTRSGAPVRAQSRASQRPNSSMYGARSSLGSGLGGPAGTCTTRAPGASSTTSGSRTASRRV
ncbi:hypothetical protein BJF77_13845 [Kocuria sp. CNJ-770]|nr:hypothetical protein BJF77_13845 [Kocuria sp. CNJ-770]